MKFDKVYESLSTYRTAKGDAVLFLLARETMQAIYDCVLQTGARDCLELGTGYGATTCVIAAALDELGRGQVTTMDIIVHEPISLRMLAEHTGLSRYIELVCDPVGYNWCLGDIIAARTSNDICAPCYDFCFLDGAHEWGVDALAVFLVAKLLRPGAWLAMDDLDFRLRGCQPNWENVFKDRSEKELDTYQLDRVFNLVVRQHPDFTDFGLSDSCRTGWARKKAGQNAEWAPVCQMLTRRDMDWQDTFDPAVLAAQGSHTDGIVTRQDAGVLRVEATRTDPYFLLPHTVAGGRPIEVIALRVRLLQPNAETLQVFWADEAATGFSEGRSMRMALSSDRQWQDLIIRINGSHKPRRIVAIRVDLTDGPATVLWESLTIGGWHEPATEASPPAGRRKRKTGKPAAA